MAAIGIHLRELRSRRKLTVRELATRSGVSHATISLVERDKTVKDPAMLERVQAGDKVRVAADKLNGQITVTSIEVTT